jgi:hypothetical protein
VSYFFFIYTCDNHHTRRSLQNFLQFLISPTKSKHLNLISGFQNDNEDDHPILSPFGLHWSIYGAANSFGLRPSWSWSLTRSERIVVGFYGTNNNNPTFLFRRRKG